VAPDPNNPVAYITPEMVYEIAKIKQVDDHTWHLPLESVARSVIGTARSMGVVCKEYEEPAAEDGGKSADRTKGDRGKQAA
jgi:Ribosomal protein L11, RNA binding domain